MDLSSLEGPPIPDSRFTVSTSVQAQHRPEIPRIHLDPSASRTPCPNYDDYPPRPASSGSTALRRYHRDQNTEKYEFRRNSLCDESGSELLHPPSSSNAYRVSESDLAAMPNSPRRHHMHDQGMQGRNHLVWCEREQTWVAFERYPRGNTAPAPSISRGLGQSQSQSRRDRYMDGDDLPPPYEKHYYDRVLVAQPMSMSTQNQGQYQGQNRRRAGPVSRWGAIARRMNRSPGESSFELQYFFPAHATRNRNNQSSMSAEHDIARFHYTTEQNIRARNTYAGDIDPSTLTFDRLWPHISPALRDIYVQRSRYLGGLAAYGMPTDGSQYENIFVEIYTAYYQGVGGGGAQNEEAMSLTTFDALLRERVGRRVNNETNPPLEADSDDAVSTEELLSRLHNRQQQPAATGNAMITRLETAVAKGVQTLNRLYHTLITEKIDVPDASDWLSEITKIKQYATPPRVIIGIVGGTGAGKSSLINALIDEENLLGTNCMRASTAVATEIAYNSSSRKRYRAEVEFVSRAEWERELGALVGDLKDSDGDGGLHDAGNSEAAVAMEKIRAVYPILGVQEITDLDVEGLLSKGGVCEVHGQTIVIESDDAKAFSKDLAVYIDSKGKRPKAATAFNDKGKAPMRTIFDNQTATATNYWPLVRVVRIYTKAPALSTGATLVDLPGIFDSNAARVAVAEEYMKKCSAHWVVAPINRAVDDKVAQDMLGQNMRVQLHMDGAANDLTFVCTKTDDVSVSEVQESLLKRDSASPGIREERVTRLENEIGAIEERLEGVNGEIQDVVERLEVLEVCAEGEGEGESKEGGGSPGKRKRDSFVSAQRPALDTSNPPNEDSSPDIRALNDRRKELTNHQRTLSTERHSKETQKEALERELENLQSNFRYECIQARNAYSKKELKHDFARGIHSFYNSSQRPPAPAQDPDYYTVLEQDLPVFCVSTRAYQKLQGRLRREAPVPGFRAVEETEIPQLQAHCIAVTEQAREASATRFLFHLRRVVRSIGLWAAAEDGVRMVSQGKKVEIEGRFYIAEESFKREVERTCEGLMQGICDILTLNVIRNFGDASILASEKCVETVKDWNDLNYNTYKAVCCRQGVFRFHNWNQELANLVIEPLMHDWKNAFEIEMPLEVDWFNQLMKSHLQAFHAQAISAAEIVLSDKTKDELKNVWKVQYKTMKRDVIWTINRARGKQRGINREFAVGVEDHMHPGYRKCAYETGPSMFHRMRDHILTQSAGIEVFQHSTDRVRSELVKLLDKMENDLISITTRLMEQTTRDYTTCIITPLVQQSASSSHQSQARIKREAADVIRGAEMELGLDGLLDDVTSSSHGHGPWEDGQRERHALETIKEEDECD